MSSLFKSIADGMNTVLQAAAKWQFKIALLILGLMPFPIAIDIIGRTMFRSPLPGCMEIEEFCMVLLLFFSLPFTEYSRTQISIDFITKYFSKTVNTALDVAYKLMAAVFLFTAAYWAVQQAITQSAITTAELLIPIWPFLIVVALGMTVAGFISLMQLFYAMAELSEQRKGLLIPIMLLAAAALCSCPLWMKYFGIKISKSNLGVIGWTLMLALLFLRFPLAHSMGLIGMLGLCLVNRNLAAGLSLVGIAPYNAMMNFVMVSVPLFVLMGEVTSKSGISRDLFEAASTWLGRVPGGLAMSAVAGCAGFAAICGESLPTAVTMSSVALPEMQHMKYRDDLSCGALAAGGTLGILIPPSVGFIFYSVVTEQSVGRLFMAGMIPGLILAGMFMLIIFFTALHDPAAAPAGPSTTFGEKLRCLRKVIGFTFIFLVIILGIMTGLMNPTEASAIGCLAAFIIAALGRRLNLTLVKESFEETMKIVSRLLYILAGVGVLGFFLAQTKLPTNMASWIAGLGFSKYVTLAIILLIWVALGCVLNVLPMIMLTLPALFPTVEMLGFDPIWFGVVAVIVMEMGQLTPPVGIVCFAVSSVGNVPLPTVFKGILPFFICMWLLVLLLIFCPQIATWLPDMLFS
ncbi:MAG: TRAP transporter large permease subunit [Mailhella sp.]|nr:TRAP transporter large permease subunit [Mailhella sp.]